MSQSCGFYGIETDTTQLKPKGQSYVCFPMCDPIQHRQLHPDPPQSALCAASELLSKSQCWLCLLNYIIQNSMYCYCLFPLNLKSLLLLKCNVTRFYFKILRSEPNMC